jgi:hypothetical protein|nr:MAG TPA: hypothetical protein [Caudoviricetes sp.]
MSKLIGDAKYGDLVTFTVYPAQIIGNDFQYVKVIGIVNAQVAESLGLNAYTLHQQVYPILPRGSVPNNADEYDFLLIEMQNGTKMAIGKPWIDINTLQIHVQNKATLILTNISAEKLQIVREALSANDVQIVSLEITS